MTIPHAEHLSSLILIPFSFPIPLLVPRFWRIPPLEWRSIPVSRQLISRFPESRTIFRVKSRIPRNHLQTLQDQLGVYIRRIHAYDKASALKGIWAYWDIVPLICSIYHVDRKTSIDLICKDTEEARVDVMKTFGSSVYVSALLVSTTTSLFCIRPYKYIQYCKSYFKNQTYVKGQLVSIFWCLWSWSLSMYVVLHFSGKVRNCHSFIRLFVRSFIHSCIHAFIHQSFTNLTLLS